MSSRVPWPKLGPQAATLSRCDLWIAIRFWDLWFMRVLPMPGKQEELAMVAQQCRVYAHRVAPAVVCAGFDRNLQLAESSRKPGVHT